MLHADHSIDTVTGGTKYCKYDTCLPLQVRIKCNIKKNDKNDNTTSSQTIKKTNGSVDSAENNHPNERNKPQSAKCAGQTVPFKTQVDRDTDKQHRSQITENSKLKVPDSGKPILDPIWRLLQNSRNNTPMIYPVRDDGCIFTLPTNLLFQDKHD